MSVNDLINFPILFEAQPLDVINAACLPLLSMHILYMCMFATSIHTLTNRETSHEVMFLESVYAALI